MYVGPEEDFVPPPPVTSRVGTKRSVEEVKLEGAFGLTTEGSDRQKKGSCMQFSKNDEGRPQFYSPKD